MNKELDRLQNTGLLQKHRVGKQLQYCANQQHPVFPELSALLRKTIGFQPQDFRERRTTNDERSWRQGLPSYLMSCRN